MRHIPKPWTENLYSIGFNGPCDRIAVTKCRFYPLDVCLQ